MGCINIFIPFLFKVISQQVSDKHLEEGRLYPPLNTIRDVSLKIAVKVRQCSLVAFLLSLATYVLLLFFLLASNVHSFSRTQGNQTQ